MCQFFVIQEYFMELWHHIATHISENNQQLFQIKAKIPLAGGCINKAYRITDNNNQQSFFVKTNQSDLITMFQVEFDSLKELHQQSILHHYQDSLRIPKPICYGTCHKMSYLVLEYIPMVSSHHQAILGKALAAQHQVYTKQYGWNQNNLIGSSHQSNQTHSHWAKFWLQERLNIQLQMLYDKGHKNTLKPLADQLIAQLDRLLGSHQPVASLLHGDLWSGNMAFDEQGKAIIFDPAIYYGDRETDLAMSELFGGFNQEFYQAYYKIWPKESGYEQRKILYNLYHILNHANLFGSSYLYQAKNMMQELIV